MPEGSNFVIAAYVVTWVGLIAYAVRLVGVTKRARTWLDDASAKGADGGQT